MRLILFDIDGTLLLTDGTGQRSYERVMNEMFGIENAWSSYSPAGKTDPLIIQELSSEALSRVLSDEEYANFKAKYCEYFKEELSSGSPVKLLPGIPEILNKLRAHESNILAIQTGNFDETARLKLASGNILEYFNVMGSGSDSIERVALIKKAIVRAQALSGCGLDKEEIYIIGDTPYDVTAGKELGLVTVGVGTGRIDTQQLRDADPDFYFEDLSDTDFVCDKLSLV